MSGRFELRKSRDGQYYFSLKASNGRVILASERYKEKKSAEAGIASVRKNAPNDRRYEKKTSGKGEPYFVLTASNGQTIGQSEMYSSAQALDRGIESIKRNAPGALLKDLTD